MTMLASQITSLTVVYSIVYSGVNQRKYQSSASLANVREIHWGPVNFPHKWPVTRKMFPFDDVIMIVTLFHDLNGWNFRRGKRNRMSVWLYLLLWLHYKLPGINKMGTKKWIGIHRRFTTGEGFFRIGAGFVTSVNIRSDVIMNDISSAISNYATRSKKLIVTRNKHRRSAEKISNFAVSNVPAEGCTCSGHITLSAVNRCHFQMHFP